MILDIEETSNRQTRRRRKQKWQGEAKYAEHGTRNGPLLTAQPSGDTGFGYSAQEQAKRRARKKELVRMLGPLIRHNLTHLSGMKG
jgi:hypothetical protein